MPTKNTGLMVFWNFVRGKQIKGMWFYGILRFYGNRTYVEVILQHHAVFIQIILGIDTSYYLFYTYIIKS